MSRKPKVPKIYADRSYRIPLCAECGLEMKMFRGKWLCDECVVFSMQAIPGWEEEEVKFRALYPNREFRRRR